MLCHYTRYKLIEKGKIMNERDYTIRNQTLLEVIIDASEKLCHTDEGILGVTMKDANNLKSLSKHMYISVLQRAKES